MRAPLYRWLHMHLVWLSFALWTLICAWSDFNSWSAYMHLVTKPVPVACHLIHLQEQSIKDSRNLLLNTSSTSLAEGCPFHAVQNLSTHHGVRRCLQAEKPQWRLLQAYEDHEYAEPFSTFNLTVHFLQSFFFYIIYIPCKNSFCLLVIISGLICIQTICGKMYF